MLPKKTNSVSPYSTPASVLHLHSLQITPLKLDSTQSTRHVLKQSYEALVTPSAAFSVPPFLVQGNMDKQREVCMVNIVCLEANPNISLPPSSQKYKPLLQGNSSLQTYYTPFLFGTWGPRCFLRERAGALKTMGGSWCKLCQGLTGRGCRDCDTVRITQITCTGPCVVSPQKITKAQIKQKLKGSLFLGGLVEKNDYNNYYTILGN